MFSKEYCGCCAQGPWQGFLAHQSYTGTSVSKASYGSDSASNVGKFIVIYQQLLAQVSDDNIKDFQSLSVMAPTDSHICICDAGQSGQEEKAAPPGRSIDWRSLYGNANGWREPRFEQHSILSKAEEEDNFIASMHLFSPGDVGWSTPDSGSQLLAIGLSDNVQVGAFSPQLIEITLSSQHINIPGSCCGATCAHQCQVWNLSDQAAPSCLLEGERQDFGNIFHALTALPGDRIAAGSNSGAIHLYEAHENVLQHSSVLHGCTWVSQNPCILAEAKACQLLTKCSCY